MRIGGLQKLSLIDYPGKVAAIVFTQGCNFRCPYCHNPELVLPECFNPAIPEDEVLSFLKRRRGQLTGVVITGGEPTQQKGLIPFLQKIKGFGYAIKLDTNGSHPQVLKEVIQQRLADYIAMDVKAPLNEYRKVAGAEVSTPCIQESIEIIRMSALPYEFRTTLVKPLISAENLPAISALIGDAPQYTIQMFRPDDKLLDKTLRDKNHYTEDEISAIKEQWERHPALPVNT